MVVQLGQTSYSLMHQWLNLSFKHNVGILYKYCNIFTFYRYFYI